MPDDAMDAGVLRTIDDLIAAADVLDRPRVDELSGRLVAQIRDDVLGVTDTVAARLLGRLRRKRFHEPLRRVADAMIQAGGDAPLVRRHYAQSLIEQGALTAAAAVLEPLVDDPAEGAEARGLLGRISKQRYVDAVPCARASPGAARNAAALAQAVHRYQSAYAANPESNFWHGINAVACAARARRDGVPLDIQVDVAATAAEVAARMAARGDNADAWELATALEAHVALGQESAAIVAAVTYSQHRDADAFEIASTLRQLEQVWCLNGTTGVGRRILPLLRGALLQRENGGVLLDSADVREAPTTQDREAVRLEKVFGTDGFTSYETYAQGVRRARTVARIGAEPGRGSGTGFLIRGSDVADRFAGEPWLLLTNAHVVSTDPAHRAALHPDEAVVTFQALSPDPTHGRPATYGVRRVLALSGPEDLDYALLQLDGDVAGVTSEDCCPVAKRPPLREPKSRVYVIGHPGGGSLSYSLQDNLLLDADDRWLHYRTPTEGGSSGSPVYNALWQLIGLHHAGSSELRRLNGQPGVYEANEGISILAIRKALHAEVSTS